MNGAVRRGLWPRGAPVAILFGALYAALALLTNPPLAAAPAATSQPGPNELSSPMRVQTTASYAVGVVRDPDRVVAGRAIAVSIALHTLAGDLPMTATAQAFPGVDGEGQPSRIALRSAGRNRYTGTLLFPAVGNWEFDIAAQTLGNPPETAVFTIPVTAPSALPVPAAWLIALLPLGAGLVFIRSEIERLHALPAPPAPERLPLARG